MSHPTLKPERTRTRILGALQLGRLTPAQLAAMLTKPRSCIDYNLAFMAKKGLVTPCGHVHVRNWGRPATQWAIVRSAK
jgi:hypothetical protein